MARWPNEQEWNEIASKEVADVPFVEARHKDGKECYRIIGSLTENELERLNNQGFSVRRKSKDPQNYKHGLLASSLWTCKCDHRFIRSKLTTKCFECGGEIGESDRMYYFESVFPEEE